MRRQTEKAESTTTAARLLVLLRGGKDLRRDKVRRIRASIRMGTYENQLKLSIALDRLLER